MIDYVKLADAIKYIEHQIKDTEYFMIEPISFLKEAIKVRKVIPLFSFDGHATICQAHRTRFEDVRQTMKVSGYFTVPYSLQEYEGSLINYSVKLDETSITVSQGIVYDLSFIDVIKFIAPFQRQGEYIEPNFHDHIQIEKNDLVNLYRHKPFLDDMQVYYASDSSPKNRMYDKIEVKTDDLHFEFSQLKALFIVDENNILNDTDKIGTPTVIQGEPKTDKELIAELKSELKQVKEKLGEQTNILASDEELTPKDSAYYLIAVLKDLLLDPNLTGFHFQTDNDKGKKEPTQSVLVEHIASIVNSK